MRDKTPDPTGEIYQIRITLLDIRPEIWRRLLVPASMNIADLHYTIQTAMGWEDCHLHAFRIRGKEYGISYEGDEGFPDDARKVRLQDFQFRVGDRFLYEYGGVSPNRRKFRHSRSNPAMIVSRLMI